MRRVESHFTSSRDGVLFTRSWAPERPERSLVLVHGFAEHSGRYEHVGEWFAARGFAVHAYDQRGHGRSPGIRGHVARFDDLLDDLGQVLERARACHPALPLIPMGHSLGGLVLATYLRERKPTVAGAVISGAPLATRGGVASRVIRAGLLRRLLPRLRIESRLPLEGLSRDPSVVQRYREDPLVFSTLTVSLAAAIAGAIERTSGGGAEIDVPLLMVHGEADPVCPFDAAREFHARVDVPDSAFRSYPELRHEIFNEPEHEEVFQDIAEWLARLGPHARVAR